MHQLTKISILIQHFSEHQKGNKTVSFLDLLVQHYAQNSTGENDVDKEDDLKLPFKSFTNPNLSPGILPALVTKINISLLFLTSNYSLTSSEDLYNSFSASVFRPPDAAVSI